VFWALLGDLFCRDCFTFAFERGAQRAPGEDGAFDPLRAIRHVGGRRLIDDYQISYLGAGRDVLCFGAALSGQPAAALVAADPDFDLRRRASSGASNERNCR
jgi:hypothetical protein